MAVPFLAARGYASGSAVPDTGLVDTARGNLEQAARAGTDVVLPADLVVAARPADDRPCRVVAAASVPAGWPGLDIGPDTAQQFARRIGGGADRLERPAGRVRVRAVRGGHQRGPGADEPGVHRGGRRRHDGRLRLLGFPERAFGLLSIGGASLEYLEGRTLPGLAALADPAVLPSPAMVADPAGADHFRPV